MSSLPALTGRTRQFKRCSNSRVRPVVGQALSNQSTCRRVGQACPISSWDRLHRTSRDRSDKSVRPVGSRFGRTVSVRTPVEHGCSSTARAAVFDRLMPAVLELIDLQTMHLLGFVQNYSEPAQLQRSNLENIGAFLISTLSNHVADYTSPVQILTSTTHIYLTQISDSTISLHQTSLTTRIYYLHTHNTDSMTPKETGRLVQYWIARLKKEQEEYIRTLKPTPYDLLTHNERVTLVLNRIKKQKEEDLNYKIGFNNLIQAHTKTRRNIRYLERSEPIH
ncbi:hypothetical protein PCANC_05176 [Puccinia coronata f. sp. avenae]|uniref:Uncharacterized protein n=1 Tax=Puccinia coronata f. sp. avenae TaxID=200324 RepID=A0A2N5W396_9BASI|nr:hypothetical protein PCANC_05176 [Puccinia coronata f. sp. avenae]